MIGPSTPAGTVVTLSREGRIALGSRLQRRHGELVRVAGRVAWVRWSGDAGSTPTPSCFLEEVADAGPVARPRRPRPAPRPKPAPPPSSAVIRPLGVAQPELVSAARDRPRVACGHGVPVSLFRPAPAPPPPAPSLKLPEAVLCADLGCQSLYRSAEPHCPSCGSEQRIPLQGVLNPAERVELPWTAVRRPRLVARASR